MKGLPASIRRAALYVSSRAASICVATWAIWCCIPCDSSNDNSTEHTVRNQSHMARCHREIKSISKLYLEVKDAFSKLAPLPGVRDCVVKAALRKAKHLKAQVITRGAIAVLNEEQHQLIQRKRVVFHLSSDSNPAPVQHSNGIPVPVTDLAQDVLLWYLKTAQT